MSNVCRILIREMTFTDGAALTVHIEKALQSLVSLSDKACSHSGINVNVNKTKAVCDDVGGIHQIPLTTTPWGDEQFHLSLYTRLQQILAEMRAG